MAQHARRLARAIGAHSQRQSEAHHARAVRGIVIATDPVACKLPSGVTLDEYEMTLGWVVQRYDIDYGLEVGDALLLSEDSEGEYVAHDIIPHGEAGLAEGSVSTAVDDTAGFEWDSSDGTTWATLIGGDLTITGTLTTGGGSGTVLWADVDKTISSLADITTRSAADLSSGTLPLARLSGITDTEVAAANKDGVAGTASMRTLGTGGTQAAAGNDSRLSDARTPTAHHTTHASAGSDPITIAESQVTSLTTDLAAKAALVSPALTGTPTAPTAAGGTNTTQIATTAFVASAVAGVTGAVSSVFGRTGAVVATSGDYAVAQVTGAAPLASPTFTGTPAAVTAAVDTNTTQLATTAYVVGQGYAKLASPTLTGDPKAPTPASGDNDTSIATTAFVTTAVNTALAIPSLRIEADGFVDALAAGSYVVDFNGGLSPSGGASSNVDAMFTYNASLDDPPTGYKTQWQLVVTYFTNATSPAKTLTWALWEVTATAGGAGSISKTMAGSFTTLTTVSAALTANNKASVSSGWSDTGAVGDIVSGKIYVPAVNIPTGGMAASSAASFMIRLYRRWVPV